MSNPISEVPLRQPANSATLQVSSGQEVPADWNQFVRRFGYRGYFQRAEWLQVLRDGLRHEPWFVTVRDEGQIVGVLPLALVRGPLFGRFLVSLPYLNSAGVLTDSDAAAGLLVDEAVRLADRLDVKNLELRHEVAVAHEALPHELRQKVHMRLQLPESQEALWDGLKSKVRSQVRKPLADTRFSVQWGQDELLGDFYNVFCCNMRDLGTPPFSKKLFRAMLDRLRSDTEICCLRWEGQPVAAAFVVHAENVTTVPSASSLRKFNHTSCNMLMYWHLLSRAVERGQATFDFGRSSLDSGTYRFKKQWAATPCPAVWQYCVREGSVGDMRPDGGRYDRMIRLWQRLPVWLTKQIGPEIVRGIP